jgi:hypothetical protein
VARHGDGPVSSRYLLMILAQAEVLHFFACSFDFGVLCLEMGRFREGCFATREDARTTDAKERRASTMDNCNKGSHSAHPVMEEKKRDSNTSVGSPEEVSW